MILIYKLRLTHPGFNTFFVFPSSHMDCLLGDQRFRGTVIPPLFFPLWVPLMLVANR